MANTALQKAPANLSKGEIYSKYMAARRTQLRRRAEATTFKQDMLDAGLVYGAGAAMGAYFQMYPAQERAFRTDTGQGVDTKLLAGIGFSAIGLVTKGLGSRLARSTGSAGLALAGADMGRSLAMNRQP